MDEQLSVVLSLSGEFADRVERLAVRRGWSVDELLASYVEVAVGLDERGDGSVLTEDERALVVTGLIALGLPETWELIEKLDKGWLLWVRSADQAEQ